MKAALRLVRGYGGGITLRDLLSSPSLMRLAGEVLLDEAAARANARREAVLDASFDANAAEFLGR